MKWSSESQEQCACCKQWGFRDEVARYYSPEAQNRPAPYDGKFVANLCGDCLEDIGGITSDELTAKQWDAVQAHIAKHGQPMAEYLAEAKAELSAKAFKRLQNRIGIYR